MSAALERRRMNLGNRQLREPGEISGLRRFSKSGYLTPSLIGLLCIILLIAAHESGHGNYHKLRERVIPVHTQPNLASGPGGQEAIMLRRPADAVSGEPEFLSATLLPGRGMNLLQLTAAVPGKGEVPVLLSPSLDEASRVLTGAGEDANGSVSTTFGAAILAPWAGRLTGAPTSSASTLESVWEGERITFPPGRLGSTISTMGLMLDRQADNVSTDTIPDGRAATAVYHAGSFSGAWPSMMEITVRAELAGKAFDLTVTEQNTGQVPEPAGIGWHPVFAIVGNRADVRVTIPSITKIEVDRRTNLPTGKTVLTGGTTADLIRARGTRLDDMSLNDTYTNLQAGILGDGPVAEIRDPAAGYGLRVTPLTASIKFMRVVAPTGAQWISIEPDTNVDDPFGHEWPNSDDTGLVSLQPGDSLQWHVRLEIFSLATPPIPVPSTNAAAPPNNESTP
jgi:galactose mutarotase-like enzyme